MASLAALLLFLSFVHSASGFSCKGKADGLYPNPKDCASFYQCFHGGNSMAKMPCPSGLVFNPNSNVCDWPSSYECKTESEPASEPTEEPEAPAEEPEAPNEEPEAPTEEPEAPTEEPEAPKEQPKPPTEQPEPPAEQPEPPTEPKPPKKGVCPRRVCYYTNWSQYRPNGGRFFPEDIDPSLCTHVIFAFAKLSGNRLETSEWNDESTKWSKGLYERLNALKNKNPKLKTLLAVGGWNMGSVPFSNMVRTRNGRQQFASQSLNFLEKWKFDGLDLDWEYPAARGGRRADKKRFTYLVQELRTTFDKRAQETNARPLLLTAAVAAGRKTVEGSYEIREISKHLDFVNLMTYDLHGAWEKTTHHNSPLFAVPNQDKDLTLNVASAAETWVRGGCPKEKLVVGIPLYGRTFELKEHVRPGIKISIGMQAVRAGKPGPYTRESGFLSFYEICDIRNKSRSLDHDSWNKEIMAPFFVYDGNQWVGYDDTDSVSIKARYIKDQGYGGVMVWALPLDDFSGKFCGHQKYPLLNAINYACGA